MQTLVHIFNGRLMFKCSVKVHLRVVVRGRELSVFSATPNKTKRDPDGSEQQFFLHKKKKIYLSFHSAFPGLELLGAGET